MASQMLSNPVLGLIGAAALAASVSYLFLAQPRITRSDGKPLKPAPNTLPLVGNGLFFLQARQILLAWFVRCQRTAGLETLALRVPSLPPGAVVHDPRIVDFIFRNEECFKKGEFVTERIFDLFGHGIINVDGPLWRAQRRAGTHFLSVRNLRVLTDVALPRYLDDAVRSLEARADGSTVVDLQAVMMELTAQLVGKMAYGMEMHADDDFTVAFDRASGYTAERFQNPLWKLTEVFTGAQYRTCLATVKSFGRRIVASAVAASATEGEKGEGEEDAELDSVSGSLIKSLMAAINDETLVADAALNYLSAGRDTVAQALTWTFYMLMRHAGAAEKLREELAAAAAAGGSAAAAETAEQQPLPSPASLPYAMAVFYETMRLYPPIPLEIKQAQQAVTLPDGTHLPRLSVVLWCTWALNRSRET
ncbi:cytochrome P450, partial [Stachybotrys elegans]